LIQKRVFGNKGEAYAVNFLKQKGYKILAQNWIHEKAEIDIIAKMEETIIFVEVKTRSTDYFGFPEESVGKAKQENILRAAQGYLENNDLNNEVRFDIVSIIATDKVHKIYHIEDAISPYDI